jgi:hypothetical protein
MSIRLVYPYAALVAFACGIVVHDARGDDLASTSGGICANPNSSCASEGETCRSSYYECCEGFENEFKGYLYYCTCDDARWLCIVSDPLCVFAGCGLPRTTPPPTPTAVPLHCIGDCDGDGRVAVHELIRGVRISLGLAAAHTCPSLVAEAESEVAVSINQLVAAVGFALRGCSEAR